MEDKRLKEIKNAIWLNDEEIEEYIKIKKKENREVFAAYDRNKKYYDLKFFTLQFIKLLKLKMWNIYIFFIRLNGGQLSYESSFYTFKILFKLSYRTIFNVEIKSEYNWPKYTKEENELFLKKVLENGEK